MDSEITMDSETTSELLGRSLTPIEQDNFDTYLAVAIQTLESLLCLDLTLDGESSFREYSPRIGYRTLYVDPYTTLESIVYNDEGVDFTTITQRQFKSRAGDWWNVIEFEDRMAVDDTITISAVWGMGEYPAALKMLIAKMFAVVSSKQASGIKSKSNEGFRVEYTATPQYEQFMLDNAALITMFRVCDTTLMYSDEYI